MPRSHAFLQEFADMHEFAAAPCLKSIQMNGFQAEGPNEKAPFHAYQAIPAAAASRLDQHRALRSFCQFIRFPRFVFRNCPLSYAVE
jgi:hypothetical protein